MRRKLKRLRQTKQKYIRARDIAEQYGIGLSTVYDWRKKGIIQNWKVVSPRCTVYLASEIEALFKPTLRIEEKEKNLSTKDTVVTKRTVRSVLKKRNKLSDSEMIQDYLDNSKPSKDYNEDNWWEALSPENDKSPEIHSHTPQRKVKTESLINNKKKRISKGKWFTPSPAVAQAEMKNAGMVQNRRIVYMKGKEHTRFLMEKHKSFQAGYDARKKGIIR